MTGSDDRKADHRNRLRRIEGQLRRLRGALEAACDDEPSNGSGWDRIEVVTELAAAIAALRAVAQRLVDEHVGACLAAAAAAEDPKHARQKLDEASQAIARLVRS
jgi:DNA-binding FrmR family transcriptional regulator